MSDVLIKGMEMPESCYQCNFCVNVMDGEDVICTALEKGIIALMAERQEDCPLIEVPENGKDINVTTNADRIRNMTDEELAKFFDSEACLFPWCDMSCTESISCRPCVMKWLKQECADDKA